MPVSRPRRPWTKSIFEPLTACVTTFIRNVLAAATTGLTGEEETMLIPVGTTVTTQLGTTTTFSRLATGDMIKILLEKDENGKDVIVGIWMIG